MNVPLDNNKLIYIIECLKHRELCIMDDCYDALEGKCDIMSLVADLDKCQLIIKCLLSHLPKDVDKSELVPYKNTWSM